MYSLIPLFLLASIKTKYHSYLNLVLTVTWSLKEKSASVIVVWHRALNKLRVIQLANILLVSLMFMIED